MATPALVSARHRVFAIPFDQGLANLIPEAKTLITPEQQKLLVVPHTHDTTRLARNLGHVTPAPILTQYDWAGDTPFRTQRITAALLTMQPRAYVLSEMGTGKTRATLHAFNFLHREKMVRKALVAAPLSTLSNVWDREIFRYFNHLSAGVLYGSRARRREILGQNHDIYIINHDGIETILPELVGRTDIDAIVVDELACYRNSNTDRWKAMAAVVNGRLFVWGLTGSPTPNEPADAYGQVKLLTPTRVPKFFRQFKQATMLQVSQFRWVPKRDAVDTVFEAMQPGVRFTRDECIELPETIYQSRQVQLSSEQARVYKEMLNRCKTMFKEGQVTAANEGVLTSKLLQIAAGWVYTNDRRVVKLPNQNRIDNLLEVLNEAEGKVIVFVEFIHAAEELVKILAANGISCALVSGRVPKGTRDGIFRAFQDDPEPRVLVAHPRCMAHGLTLTAANVIAWFLPPGSLEIYEQACARVTRPGQTRKTLMLHLTGTAIESKLYRRLQQRASLQGALLELFEQPSEELI